MNLMQWNTLKLLCCFAIALPFLTSGDDRPSSLEQVKQRGTITVLTRNGASSYYLGAEGPTGPEYELASKFAQFLGVGLQIHIAKAFNELSSLLLEHQGDFIAANLTRTSQREQYFNFGPDYLDTSVLVVYRRGMERPREVVDLVGLNIMVIAGTSYETLLEEARQEVPGLVWEARSDVGMEDLLLALSDGAIDVTLVDSSIFTLNSFFLSAGFHRVHIAGYPAPCLGFCAGR